MSLISSLRISASGLTAQRLRMDVIAGNIANVSTTRTEEGGPYRRRDVLLSAFSAPRDAIRPLAARSTTPAGVRVSGVVAHDDVRVVNDPTHPDADANGNVSYPDIDLVQEMANMISAVRAYEACVTAMNAAKSMAHKALELGRG